MTQLIEHSLTVHYSLLTEIKITMNHKNLDVWKMSMSLVEVVYALTADFPDTERYGLISQMRRSAVSIPSNIAEGTARKSDKELIQFIYIALGSVAELETQYLIAVRLNFCKESQNAEQLINETRKLLIGFRNYIKSKE